MSSFTHKGWTLHEEEIHEPDNRWTWHEAQHEDGCREILHVSPYHPLTERRFRWLVDHGFPRAPSGNWLPDELDRLIESEDS